MHLFVDNLTNVDFSYLHTERGLLGETWLASIVLEGALDEQGMVCDFGIVKKTVRNWLDDTIDHCLVVPTNSSHLSIHDSNAQNSAIEWVFGKADSSVQHLFCTSPQQAYCFIDKAEVTPKSVSAWCIEQLRKLLPDTIDRIELTFTPEPIAHHFYHYSHGLKKHNGNCQRIAHGHRSTIEIYQNGKRNHQLETDWCERWRDIYIGSQDDLVGTQLINQQTYLEFAYHAPQGEFKLTLPHSCCYLIDTDSTVELIAAHIGETLSQEHPQSDICVRAFEGAGKGALVGKI